MDYAAELPIQLNDRTQCPRHITSEINVPMTSGYLIAVHQKGRLIKIFRPSGKNIGVGRSSRCDLVLPDPQFPRKAGEIILGPVPILRKSSNSERKGHLTPFSSGKPLRIGSYSLTLLEPGDAIFNRFIKKNTKRIKLWRFCSVIGAGAIVVFLLLLKTNLINVYQFGQPSSPINESKLKKVEKSTAIKVRSVPLSEDILFRKAPPQKNIANNKEINPQEALPLQNSSQVLTRRGQKSQFLKSKLPAISKIQTDEFDRILKMSAGFIEKGSLKTASHTLRPFLPFIDREQRALMIGKLDPGLEKHFIKAYVLKPFEPEKSKAILLDIVESGFVDFPAYLKAQKLLDRN